MGMPIFSGRLKGRHLQFDFDKQPRPTMGKVREAFFNIVKGPLEGSSFLDCFAGTGAMGFEALSRGAARVVFIEIDHKLVAALLDNARRLGVEKEIRVASGPCAHMLRRFGKEAEEKFDLVYIDPPYDNPIADEALILLRDNDLLKPGFTAVIERSRKDTKGGAALLEAGFVKSDSRRYGAASLEFWQAP